MRIMSSSPCSPYIRRHPLRARLVPWPVWLRGGRRRARAPAVLTARRRASASPRLAYEGLPGPHRLKAVMARNIFFYRIIDTAEVVICRARIAEKS